MRHIEQFLSEDSPIDSRQQDRLERWEFARRMAAIISERKGKDSFVIALNGPWGGGKTSVKNMVLDALNDYPAQERLEVVSFEPWVWSNTEQLVRAFFDEVSVAIQNIARLNDENAQPSSDTQATRRRLDLLHHYKDALTGNVLDSEFLRADRFLDPRTGVWESVDTEATPANPTNRTEKPDDAGLALLQSRLRRSFAELKKPILVVIDDIDRLTPDEIPTIFKLVKANANFPNLIYLLIFQRDTVEIAMDKLTTNHGKEYLEKIVQVAFDIPLVRPAYLRQIVEGEISAVLGSEARVLKTEEGRRVIEEALTGFLTNIRVLRRFINSLAFQIAMFSPQGSLEVNPLDLIALEALRVFEPGIYRRLAKHRDLLLGLRNSSITTLEEYQALRNEFLGLCERATPEFQSAVERLLSILFPAIDKTFNLDVSHMSLYKIPPTTEFESNDRAFLTWSISHPDFFDGYFQLSIPQKAYSRSMHGRLFESTNDRQKFTAHLRQMADEHQLGECLHHLEVAAGELSMPQAENVISGLLDIEEMLIRYTTGESGDVVSSAKSIIHHLLQPGGGGESSINLWDIVGTTNALYLPAILENPVQDSQPTSVGWEMYEKNRCIRLDPPHSIVFRHLQTALETDRIQRHEASVMLIGRLLHLASVECRTIVESELMPDSPFDWNFIRNNDRTISPLEYWKETGLLPPLRSGRGDAPRDPLADLPVAPLAPEPLAMNVLNVQDIKLTRHKDVDQKEQQENERMFRECLQKLSERRETVETHQNQIRKRIQSWFRRNTGTAVMKSVAMAFEQERLAPKDIANLLGMQRVIRSFVASIPKMTDSESAALLQHCVNRLKSYRRKGDRNREDDPYRLPWE